MSDKNKPSSSSDVVSFPDAVGGVRPLKQDRITPPRKNANRSPSRLCATSARSWTACCPTIMNLPTSRPARNCSTPDLGYNTASCASCVAPIRHRSPARSPWQHCPRSARARQRVPARDAGTGPTLRAHHPRQGQKLGREAAGTEGKGKRLATAVGIKCSPSAPRPNDGGTGAVYVLLRRKA